MGRPTNVEREARLKSSTKEELPKDVDGVDVHSGREMTPVTGPASADLVQAFLAAMQQMSADNRETTLAAIAELKKPSAEEQAKIDEEKASLLAQSERRVEAAKEQEADIAARRASCSHTMPNGQTNFRGQVMSNGWAGVFCSHCWDAYAFEATDIEKSQSGLNVDKWGPNAFSIIKGRVASSKDKTPPPIPRVPPGATIIFG